MNARVACAGINNGESISLPSRRARWRGLSGRPSPTLAADAMDR